jgi:hypothetical protein
MRIAGIPRNPKNSPNMSDKDMQLFNEIAEELKKAGHTVEVLGEEEHIPNGYDAIFHMSRTTSTLERLTECEAKGTFVTNASDGVRNCSRRNFVEILKKNGIRQPEHTIINTAHKDKMPQLPGWLKKSVGWACNATDVQFVATEEEYTQALATLAANGASEAIFCKHIEGDIVKFYAIRGEEFFRWHYPDITTTKFGLEKINGEPQQYKFSTEELRETALRAAAAMDIDIFGGDCIITAKGEIYIIDINDFPSFSSYRSEAAKKIASLITKRR